MKKAVIVFPSSYFDSHKVDEDLESEYNAVVETGMFDVVLFSYDKWFNENKLVLDNDEETIGIYRGWMMKPEMYSEFYSRLDEKGIRIITTPEEYERFHIFPNIYPVFNEDTAKMLVYPDGVIDLEEVKKSFRRFMVKDYVKSVKGTDFPLYFDNNVSPLEFAGQMEKFYKYRSGLRTGGICIKEFLDLKRYSDHTNEFRVFYINGQVGTVSRNSLQESFVPSPPDELINKYAGLDSPLYTIDYAELSDGIWKVIEAGDGQVSGLSDGQDNAAFFRALYFGLFDKFN